MMFPTYNKTEQKAILNLTAAVAFNNGWKDNEKRLLNAIAHRFGFSLQDTGDATMMDHNQAILTIKNMDSSKKKIVSCLFQSAAMADGDMRMGKPQWDHFFDIASQCNIPMDISYSEALNLTHEYLEC